MIRIVLHVGTHKTGTTSIQNLLYRNRDLLKAEGILYPQTGIVRQEHIGYRHRGLLNQFMIGKPACPEALQHEIAQSGCHTVILSCEAWSDPNCFAHVTQLATELHEPGRTQVQGIIAFRNLAQYQVSRYREFTVNQRNPQPYRNYVHKPAGVFDYLYVLQSYRGLFGADLSVLQFDAMTDASRTFVETAGFGHLWDRLDPVGRANVKQITPVDVEVMRCGHVAGAKDGTWQQVRDALVAASPAVADTVWTERFEGDVPRFSAAYHGRFRELSGWDAAATERLFDKGKVAGRNVESLTAEIEAAYKGTPLRSGLFGLWR